MGRLRKPSNGLHPAWLSNKIKEKSLGWKRCKGDEKHFHVLYLQRNDHSNNVGISQHPLYTLFSVHLMHISLSCTPAWKEGTKYVLRILVYTSTVLFISENSSLLMLFSRNCCNWGKKVQSNIWISSSLEHHHDSSFGPKNQYTASLSLYSSLPAVTLANGLQ